MLNPWLGMALVMAILGSLVFGLRLYQKWDEPHPELVRKLLHIGMGLVAAAFPWIFDRLWPVAVLGVLSLGSMIALRVVQGLKTSVGCVVTGVSRSSFGEMYFPIAIFILFLFYLADSESPSQERTILYCIPILLLTIADAVAALIGVHYGRWHYATSDGKKSAEGSVAFFVVAFLCVHIPLLVGTDVGRVESLLIAALIAWLGMMFEAIAWAGLDNLALPLISHLLLRIYLEDMRVDDLVLRLAVSSGLMAFVLIYQTRTTLHGSAVIGACLVGYICWALGDWRWVVPPLVLFLSYTLLSPRTPMNTRRIANIHAVVCVSSAGLICLFLYKTLKIDNSEGCFYYLFTLSFAAQLALIAVARLGYDYADMKPVPLLALCIVKGWLFLFLPYLMIKWDTPNVVRLSLGALPGVALAAVAFYITQPQVRDCPSDAPRWLRQGLSAACGAALGLLPLYLA